MDFIPPEKAGIDLRTDAGKRDDAKEAGRQFTPKFMGHEDEYHKGESNAL